MNLIHQTVLYHEDEHPVKRPLTDDEKIFLTQLQREINTQNHLSTADPRYWVILDYHRIYGKDMSVHDGYALKCTDNDTVVAEAETPHDLITAMTEFFQNESPNVFKNAEFPERINDFMEFVMSKGFKKFEVVQYYDMEQQSQVFFSHAGAIKYLEKFSYHFTPKAHVYCDCALYNDEMAQLVKILHEADLTERSNS